MKVPERTRHCPECDITFVEPEHDDDEDCYAGTLCPRCYGVGIVVGVEPSKAERRPAGVAWPS